jgi:hypothetical protein
MRREFRTGLAVSLALTALASSSCKNPGPVVVQTPAVTHGFVRLEGYFLKYATTRSRVYSLEDGANLDAVLNTLFTTWYDYRNFYKDNWVVLIRESGGERTAITYYFATMEPQELEAIKLKDGDVLRFETLKIY